MKTEIKKSSDGLPFFQESTPILTRSLLTENRSFSHIKPSSLSQNSVIRFIGKLVHQILNWLYPFAKTPYVGIIEAFDIRLDQDRAPLSPEESLQFLKRFFDGDTASSPQVKRCLNELEEQYRLIKKYPQPPAHAPRVERPDFLAQLTQTVQNLKEGEESLIVASASPEDDLFFLFSKQNGETRLKVLGRGSMMRSLSGIDHVAVAGRAKVVSSLDCGAVDNDFIDKLLSCTPLAFEPAPFGDAKKLLEARISVDSVDMDNLAVKTDNVFKIFWNTLSAVNLNAGHTKDDERRNKLRLELFTLFSLVKETRYTLDGNPQERDMLSHMLKLCAQKVQKAHQRELLSQDELKTIVAELKTVQQILDQADHARHVKVPQIKLPSMALYGYQNMTPLNRVDTIVAPPLPKAHHARGAQKIPEISSKAPLVLPPLERVDNRLPMNERLLWLLNRPFEEMVRGILDLKIFLEDGLDPIQNTPAFVGFWTKIKAPEANELFTLINGVSEELVKRAEENQEMGIDVYMALAKLTDILGHLHCEHTPTRFQKPSAEEKILIQKLSYYDSPFSCGYQFTARSGNYAYPESLTAYKELSATKMYSFFHPRPRQPNELDIQHSFNIYNLDPPLNHLQRQCDLLAHYLPHIAYMEPKNFGPFKERRADDHNAIFSLLGGWINNLPLPLLAVYHAMKVDLYGGLRGLDENRHAPEAIQHDPESTLEIYEKLVLGGEVSKWIESVEKEIENPSSLYEFVQDYRSEIVLRHSSFLAQRPNRLKELLKVCKKNLAKMAEIPFDLSKEDLTSLLRLCVNRMSYEEKPYFEMKPFLKTKMHLLENPAIRTFVRLIFFGRNLLPTLESFPEFFSIPQFFSEQIEHWKEKAELDINVIPTLLFFIQMSEQLKAIYQKLNKPTDAFFSVESPEIQTLFDRVRAQEPNSLLSKEIACLQLTHLLKHETFSEKELCQIISDMHLLNQHTNDYDPFMRRDLFWLQEGFNHLLQHGGSYLSKAYLDPLLDQLCVQKGLPLDNSAWVGHFPKFKNALYEIDIQTGDVIDRTSGGGLRRLPQDLLDDPLFHKNFPELISTENLASVSIKPDGSKIYFIQTDKAHYRFEKDGADYRMYRTVTLDGKERLLQAAILERATPSVAPAPNNTHSFLDRVKHCLSWLPKQTPIVPAMLQQRLFFDPQNPKKGYILNKDDALELELSIKQKSKSVEIENVIDMRGNKPSKPSRLIGLSEINCEALKELERIEDRAHILVWGDHKGKLEKIELPRYGLQFNIQQGRLVCLSSHLAGYRVALGASLKEKKGFRFSLLLEHPDRTRPKKLIMPPSQSILRGHSHLPPRNGPAYFIWIAKTALSFIRDSMQPLPIFPTLQIEDKSPHLLLNEFDLLVHTDDILYAQDKELEQRQDLMRHALLQENSSLLFSLIEGCTIEKEEMAARKWIAFLKTLGTDRYAAPLGLKVSEKIYHTIAGIKKYEPLRESLMRIESEFFKHYLKNIKKLTQRERISSEQFKRLADFLKKEDPSFYQMHLAPFFLEEGQSYEFPVVNIDGTMTELPHLPPVAAEEDTAEPVEIHELEAQIKPEEALSPDQLVHTLNLSEKATPLIFNDHDLAPYFEDNKVCDAKKLQNRLVRPTLEKLKKEKEEAYQHLDTLIHHTADLSEQLTIFSQNKQLASLSDLHMALLQNDFGSLRAKLPEETDLNALKKALITYYEAEIKVQLLHRADQELSKMIAQKSHLTPSIWQAQSETLHALLSHERLYDPESNPELLAFEAFHFVTFRTSQESSQLKLLQELLSAQSSIIQAGTGTGKSSVLSVLRGLMRANGQNLVTQKVLPHLYQETLTLLQKRLGHVFGRKITPLLFNQAMPLVDHQGQSLFEQIYHNLLITIQNKGCVLTDYKSFVLLEEKFITLSCQLASMVESKADIPAITLSHWLYLNKILILLKNRDDQLMDEFDQPMNPVQRIQTQMREGAPFPKWMIEESLALFDLLSQEKELYLEKGLHGDISEAQRLSSIDAVARKVAEQKAKEEATPELIYRYLMGHDTELFAHLSAFSAEERDCLALLKDQFTTFLPLTLSRSGLSDYARSPDGKKIVTCSKGERREAKFGNPIEEINYSIQDYLQRKVALPTLRDFFLESKKRYQKDPEGEEEAFREIFPSLSLGAISQLNPDDFDSLCAQKLKEVNRDPQMVRVFLERHLRSLRSSGVVVSMNPQDSVAMSLAVSGVSATTGSLGALHDQFKRDEEAAIKNQKVMIDRLKHRSFGAPIRYNPHEPLQMLAVFKQEPNMCALIDGAGAFRSLRPRQVAKTMLELSPTLKRVDYYDKEGRVRFVGDPSASLAEKGFYFPQAQTRGSDQLLRPDGIALQTASDKGTIEDFIQEEGRMRHPQQRILVALSEFAPASINSFDDLIDDKKKSENDKHAEDRYRAEPQRLRQMIRAAARERLLQTTDLAQLETLLDNPKTESHQFIPFLMPFLDLFDKTKSYFIQAIQVQESEEGDYFMQHKDLVRKEADPVAELALYKQQLLNECHRLELDTTLLDAYDPDSMRESLPESVYPLAAVQDQQQEVQEELEVNNELLLELENEQEQEQELDIKKVAAYLPRVAWHTGCIKASSFHSHFSDKIEFQEEFLHLYRTDPLHRRSPFDDRMMRIGRIHVATQNGRISGVTIEDVVNHYEFWHRQATITGKETSQDLTGIPDPIKNEFLNVESPQWHHYRYSKKWYGYPIDPKYTGLTDETRQLHATITAEDKWELDCSFFYDIRSNEITDQLMDASWILERDEFISLIAQVKFLDGMIDGYTPKEAEALKKWLSEGDAASLRRYFTDTILKHRPEQRFNRRCQLYQIFEDVQKSAVAIEDRGGPSE